MSVAVLAVVMTVVETRAVVERCGEVGRLNKQLCLHQLHRALTVSRLVLLRVESKSKSLFELVMIVLDVSLNK